MKNNIALFDFDGTITTKDSLLEFVKSYRGNFSFYLGMTFLLPLLISMKMKFVSDHFTKETFLRYFFKGENEQCFNSHCIHFSNNVLPSFVKPEAMKRIRYHHKCGDDVYIVSASLEQYLAPWAEKNNCKLLATQIEVINGKITGKLKGKNCKGDEKVRRIKKAVNLKNYNKIYAYGDSGGDHQMLALADYSFYKHYQG